MQGKFEINWDHYLSEKSKLIYAENRVESKALQHFEPCFWLNFITSFTTINDLFNHLKDIFGNPHWKKHVREKFRELKMVTSSCNDFYSEFNWLTSDLEYISEMLILKFKHKLTPHLQDRLNSSIELSSNIFALAKRCLSIYEQMQAIDQIKQRTKSSTAVQNTATNVFLKTITSSFQALSLLSNNNNFFSRFFNSFWRTITPIPQTFDAELLWLMKKGRCFNCKGRGHTMLNCLKKAKVSTILDTLDIDNIEDIN